ncbi:MAG: beta-ketoacyl-ACP synthase III [Candidatus Pelagibacterales bacterium]|jgi:beta-ketodecanoyl-[acyl-carrier-protein] synthase|nr:beta-ketoacyl-ACP synthase III [Pelagibacterales bacterium]MDB9818575.1 beta-ketoacyl-ACP synthase III [Pelagibacterales bacterium]|tara:strand:+ start:1064 stop:2191 length:1128 start_codon:yes stop_codon:yes gene_type:complete
MTRIQISGTGLFTPKEILTNDELVNSYNKFVDEFNIENEDKIKTGEIEELQKSSSEFIEKASGVKARYVQNKSGILDTKFMRPLLRERKEDELSNLAEMGVIAAKQAIENANIDIEKIDAVIVACSNLERPYPAIAIEIQNALNIEGFAFDMNVACSSATFGIQTIYDMIKSGSIRSALMVNPEICSGHLNFKDRDCHFIFGDVATAVVIEELKEVPSNSNSYEILSTKLYTQFSNNIRNNYGFLNSSSPDGVGKADKLFHQNGRQVFKEVVPKVASLIKEHLEKNSIEVTNIKAMYLHQANENMNRLISKYILGHEASRDFAPIVLDEYANTSSAGSIIAFHKHNNSLKKDDLAIICSFGAGYSIGNVIVRKLG